MLSGSAPWSRGFKRRSVISATRFGEIISILAILWMIYLVFVKLLYQLWHMYASG